MAEETVRIAGIVRQSIVDGPGLRLTVFTQGCPHHCPGCHNPHTHDFSGGYDCTVESIVAAFDANPLLAGITLSGGEPFERAGELIPLAQQIRDRGKNVYCYTGYTLEQLLERQDADTSHLLGLIDVLIDGPYRQAERDLKLRFRGSRNQRVLDLPCSLSEGCAVVAQLAE